MLTVCHGPLGEEKSVSTVSLYFNSNLLSFLYLNRSLNLVCICSLETYGLPIATNAPVLMQMLWTAKPRSALLHPHAKLEKGL